MKMDLCLYFNQLPLYRKTIFKLLDQRYNCVWYVDEKTDNSIQCFDEDEINIVNKLRVLKIGPLVWTVGLVKLLHLKCDNYLFIGSTRNLSLLFFLIVKSLSHSNKRVSLWSHGFYGKESFFVKIYKRMLFKLADEVFVYGDYSRKLMIDEGLKKEHLHVIHNSLSYDEQSAIRRNSTTTNIYRSHFNNNNPNLIFIGRLTKEKKLDLLLDAIALLKKNSKSYNVTFIGEGISKEDLTRKVHYLGLEDNVWFYGASYDEIINAEFLYNADLCVSPGNVGLTAIHSMMFGCPVITHDDFKYQMPEFESIKKGKTGDFYKNEDFSDLAFIIDKWFEENKHQRELIRHACFEEIDSSWNPYYQLKVFDSVMNS